MRRRGRLSFKGRGWERSSVALHVSLSCLAAVFSGSACRLRGLDAGMSWGKGGWRRWSGSVGDGVGEEMETAAGVRFGYRVGDKTGALDLEEQKGR